MNIALVGGIERKETELASIASRAGHRLEYHGGHIGGRGADGLRACIERADLVVLQTAVNSHGSMYLAKKLARQLGKELIVIRNCGPSRFATMLDALHKRCKSVPATDLRRCA